MGVTHQIKVIANRTYNLEHVYTYRNETLILCRRKVSLWHDTPLHYITLTHGAKTISCSSAKNVCAPMLLMIIP